MKKVSSITRRRTNLCRAIEIAYDSASTHFSGAIKQEKPISLAGDLFFNAKTIREYAEIILICAVELEFLARKPRKKRASSTPIVDETHK